jgi:hypothetical protein
MQTVSIESLNSNKNSGKKVLPKKDVPLSCSKPEAKAQASSAFLKETNQSESRPMIKAQNVVEEVGHFKHFRDGKVLVNFIDKVKLFMDDASLEMFLDGKLDKSFCFIYLPDNSEHEVCMAEKNTLNFFFTKYIAFLEQWINWLIDTKAIKRGGNETSSATATAQSAGLNSDALQMHLNQLKLFNYTIEQNTNMSCHGSNQTEQSSKVSTAAESANTEMSLVAVSNLLRQNNKFLSEISK